MLRAGIDIGTNTILMLIADVSETGSIRVLEDHVRVVRLGQEVDKNRLFHPDAMDRARHCFQEYATILKKYPGVAIRAVATSGSRDAKNSEEFFAEIQHDTGIAIRIISGEEEALMSFRGAFAPGDLPADQAAVLDIGGGSTEVVGLLSGTTNLFRYSFDLGCVRLTERFLHSDPPSQEQVTALVTYVRAELSKQSAALKGLEKTLVGVAGTATYLASSHLGLQTFDPEKVHFTKLKRADIAQLVDRFTYMTAAQRLGIGGMDKGRADVILGGALLLREFLQEAELEEMLVSVRGLRFGAVL